MKRLPIDPLVVETEHFVVNQDWEVPIVGFFVLAPKRKLRSTLELRKAEQEECFALLMQTRKAMKEVLGFDNVYLFASEDSKFGFHIWFFPRHEWMKQWEPGPATMLEIMEHAKKESMTPEQLEQVQDAVVKMRKYMKK